VTPPLPLLAAGDPLEHVLPHALQRIGGYTITNHIVMLVVSAILLAFLVPLAVRSRDIVPRGARNLVESVLQYLREEMARPALGSHTDEFMPFLWTMFFLILTANLLGLVPLGSVLGNVDAHLSHMEGTATGNLSITAGLAFCSLIYIHFSGMRRQGVGGYWKSFFFGHAPVWLAPLMMPLEIFGALVKPFALAMRLFANMIAGHIVIAVIVGFSVLGLTRGGGFYGITLVSVAGAVAMSLLEVFVAFLQAYIFTFLTTLFVGLAIHTEH
jgi:F-type H+-transporting ATPase subunit a